MAKKREIFKVNEDALKDMMASESISCAKPETGSIENLPSREAENEVQEVEKREQKKLRKAVHTDPNMDERLDLYRTQFLERKKTVQKRQTYISYEIYQRLARALPVFNADMTIPAFLDNVLTHHLDTYSEELDELFRRNTQKSF